MSMFLENCKNTWFEKYGVDNPSKLPTHKETILKYWGYESVEEKNDFEIFSYKVRLNSIRNYKKLYEEWDGNDYYTSECIRNLTKNKYDDNYPNVDHKVSIKYGFMNGYTIEELSNISNLCITSRKTNLNKSVKTENEFINEK